MNSDNKKASVVGGKPDDNLSPEVSCLSPLTLQASLVSTSGSHCEVWRSNRRLVAFSGYQEFVLKFPKDQLLEQDITTLMRDHRRLHDALEDIVPSSLFFVADINAKPSLCIIAEAVDVWFNIANPQNREEAVALLESHPKARNQLERFVSIAKQWRSSDSPRLIDLFGIDNLVMDINREIRYLDSFFVFFFEDLPHLLAEVDPALEEKIAVSVERLNYLDGLLH